MICSDGFHSNFKANRGGSQSKVYYCQIDVRGSNSNLVYEGCVSTLRVFHQNLLQLHSTILDIELSIKIQVLILIFQCLIGIKYVVWQNYRQASMSHKSQLLANTFISFKIGACAKYQKKITSLLSKLTILKYLKKFLKHLPTVQGSRRLQQNCLQSFTRS